jgi:O-methyltransferase
VSGPVPTRLARRAWAALRRRRARLLTAPPKQAFTVGAGLDAEERAIVAACQPYTMVSTQRLVATIDAVKHVVRSEISGALVECGVWRGGSALAMLLTLQGVGVDDRDIYLFDTFEGMTEPTDADTSRFDGSAVATWEQAAARGRPALEQIFNPGVFGHKQVEDLLTGTGYPAERLLLVAGPVEETLPGAAPDQIAVLRLDTDWYESTRHELEHLYPRLAPGGVLLVDDYGHWDGARKAFDEYFDQRGGRPLLARTDYTGRLAVKPDSRA